MEDVHLPCSLVEPTSACTLQRGAGVCSGASCIRQTGAWLEPQLKVLWAQSILSMMSQGAEPRAGGLWLMLNCKERSDAMWSQEVELVCMGSMHRCSSGSKFVGWTYVS